MIKTKIEIEFALDLMSPEILTSKIVYGQLDNPKWTNDFNNVTVPFRYFYINDAEQEVLIKGGEYHISKDQINTLGASIQLVNTLKTDKERELFHKAFMILMSSSYGISVNDIEII